MAGSSRWHSRGAKAMMPNQALQSTAWTSLRSVQPTHDLGH
jgi:hypothetical protein